MTIFFYKVGGGSLFLVCNLKHMLAEIMKAYCNEITETLGYAHENVNITSTEFFHGRKCAELTIFKCRFLEVIPRSIAPVPLIEDKR